LAILNHFAGVSLRDTIDLVIASFKDSDTRAVFERRNVARWRNIEAVAYRKLLMLHAANLLDDLRSPPGNRLEALKGDRKGQHSIRISKQWRVCFAWRDGAAHAVEICDYH
jgi:proteic killer suppression protein